MLGGADVVVVTGPLGLDVVVVIPGLTVVVVVVIGTFGPVVVTGTELAHGLFGIRFVGPFIASTIVFVRINGVP